MLLIVYLGYYILKRQEVERNRLEALAKAKPKSSSSSTNSGFNKDKKPLSSSDVRDDKLGAPSNKQVGDSTPKQVSGSSKEDPSAQSFRKNYFLTMQGPGRPAIVPFQDGLRPKKERLRAPCGGIMYPMVRIESLHDPNNLCSQLTFTT